MRLVNLGNFGEAGIPPRLKDWHITKLGDWRSLASEGVSSFSTFSCCTKIGDYVHPLVVFHLNAKATQLAREKGTRMLSVRADYVLSSLQLRMGDYRYRN